MRRQRLCAAAQGWLAIKGGPAIGPLLASLPIGKLLLRFVRTARDERDATP